MRAWSRTFRRELRRLALPAVLLASSVGISSNSWFMFFGFLALPLPLTALHAWTLMQAGGLRVVGALLCGALVTGAFAVGFEPLREAVLFVVIFLPLGAFLFYLSRDRQSP